MAKSKRKKPSKLEAHLKELYLTLIEVLKYNPDFWDQHLLFDDKHIRDIKSLVEDWKGLWDEDLLFEDRAIRDAKSFVEDWEDHWDEDRYIKRRKFSFEYLQRLLEKHPTFESLLEHHSSEPGGLYRLYNHLVTTLAYDKERFSAVMAVPEGRDLGMHPESSGLGVFVNLRFEDGLIKGLFDALLDYYFLPHYKEDPLWKNIYSAEDWVLRFEKGLEVVFARRDTTFVEFKINLTASKVRIRKAFVELLQEYSSRKTVSPTRFHPKKWEEAYRIYDLKLQGFSFEEIAIQFGKPLSTIHGLYKGLWEHIHGREYGTKRKRAQESGEEYPFDDANHGWGAWIRPKEMPGLEDAEREMASSGLLGGSGRRKASYIVSRDDEEGTFFNTAMDETWEEVELTRFDNWGRRFGNTNSCKEGVVVNKGSCKTKLPVIGFTSFGKPDTDCQFDKVRRQRINPNDRTDWEWVSTGVERYLECSGFRDFPPRLYKVDSGSERCSTCSQPYPTSWYKTGSIDGIPYCRRYPALASRGPFNPKTTKQNIERMFRESEEEGQVYPGTGKKGSPEFDHVNVGYQQYLSYLEWRHLRIDEDIALDISREDEFVLQAEYITRYGTSPNCPLKLGKGFGPRWGWTIAYGPMPEKPSRMKINTEKWAHLLGQYSKCFSMQKDLLEQLLASLIDQRAQGSRQKLSI